MTEQEYDTRFKVALAAKFPGYVAHIARAAEIIDGVPTSARQMWLEQVSHFTVSVALEAVDTLWSETEGKVSYDALPLTVARKCREIIKERSAKSEASGKKSAAQLRIGKSGTTYRVPKCLTCSDHGLLTAIHPLTVAQVRGGKLDLKSTPSARAEVRHYFVACECNAGRYYTDPIRSVPYQLYNNPGVVLWPRKCFTSDLDSKMHEMEMIGHEPEFIDSVIKACVESAPATQQEFD